MSRSWLRAARRGDYDIWGKTICWDHDADVNFQIVADASARSLLEWTLDRG